MTLETIELTPGVLNHITNGTPGVIEFELQTTGGTRILVKLPPNGECAIAPGTDLLTPHLTLHPIGPLGPRSVE